MTVIALGVVNNLNANCNNTSLGSDNQKLPAMKRILISKVATLELNLNPNLEISVVCYLHLVVESQCTLSRAHKSVKSWRSNDPAPAETAEMEIFSRPMPFCAEGAKRHY